MGGVESCGQAEGWGIRSWDTSFNVLALLEERMRTAKRVTGVNSRSLIRRVLRWLHARGWSAGEAISRGPDGLPRWNVDATHHSGQTIRASATTRSGAWEFACRKVGQVPTDF